MGATEKTLQRYIDHEYNPDYDINIYWKYYTWLYIAQNGKLTLDDDKIENEIIRDFGQITGEVKSLPMHIHNFWLDQLSIYKKK